MVPEGTGLGVRGNSYTISYRLLREKNLLKQECRAQERDSHLFAGSAVASANFSWQKGDCPRFPSFLPLSIVISDVLHSAASLEEEKWPENEI
jgi:hypothetical protein